MPPRTEFTEIQITEFRGLFNRGLSDSVPRNYFSDCLNVKFDIGRVFTREGTEKIFDQDDIRRVFVYKRLGETPRHLVLTTTGDLYDSLYPGTPLISNVEFLDFSAVNFFNRAYLTFHNRKTGIPASNLYIYEGAGPGTLRLAAGSPPTGFVLGVEDSPDSGSVEKGIHLFAVVFETSSGYLTAPGPEVFAQLDAAGDKKVHLTNIIPGPAGTVARRIIATKVAIDYDGNQLSQEFFFVPDGRIPDNTTTEFTVDFYDDDLNRSADYLFDNYSTIPGGLGLATYSDRLVLWGVHGSEHVIFISNKLEPEVFSTIDGYITCDPSDSIAGVRNCHEHRSTLFVHKPNRTYGATDNGNAPNTWGLVPIDRGAGTEVFGVSQILDSKGDNTDRFFIADVSGLLVYEAAVFKRPEMSWNIEAIWKRINRVQFNKVVVAHDTEKQHIYVGVPLDTATEISHVLFADYSQSFSPIGFIIPTSVKWSVWTLKGAELVSHIFVDINHLDSRARFNYSLLSGNIYQQDEGLTNDDSLAFESYWESYLMSVALNKINFFGLIQSRVRGNGLLDIILSGQDGIKLTQFLQAWPLSDTQGHTRKRWINFWNEKMKIKFRLRFIDERFEFSNVTVKSKVLWENRPSEQ